LATIARVCKEKAAFKFEKVELEADFDLSSPKTIA